MDRLRPTGVSALADFGRRPTESESGTKKPRKRFGIKFISQEQQEWLTSAATLSAHVGLSLKDRCKLFHRQFPERKMNETLLRKIYRLHGVKKKVIRWKKRLKANTLKKFEKLKEDLRKEVQLARDQGFEILYTDECMFTRKSLQPIEYSRRSCNVEVDLEMINEPAHALILAVSNERGVVA